MTGWTATSWAALAWTQLAGCGGDSGSWHACQCDYVTDTDVPGRVAVELCVPEGARPDAEAASCAAGLGVGSVERCVCEASTRVCSPPSCAQRAASGQ